MHGAAVVLLIYQRTRNVWRRLWEVKSGQMSAPGQLAVAASQLPLITNYPPCPLVLKSAPSEAWTHSPAPFHLRLVTDKNNEPLVLLREHFPHIFIFFSNYFFFEGWKRWQFYGHIITLGSCNLSQNQIRLRLGVGQVSFRALNSFLHPCSEYINCLNKGRTHFCYLHSPPPLLMNVQQVACCVLMFKYQGRLLISSPNIKLCDINSWHAAVMTHGLTGFVSGLINFTMF